VAVSSGLLGVALEKQKCCFLSLAAPKAGALPTALHLVLYQYIIRYRILCCQENRILKWKGPVFSGPTALF